MPNQMYSIPPFELEDITSAAREVIELCKEDSIWLLEGEMGAGKTTFVKAIGKVLGVVNTIQSPTFSIVNQYLTSAGDTIYHFDCYRLKSIAEAFDIGVEEYLDSGALCLIEWPDKIADLLPARFKKITIKEVANGKRAITVTDNVDI